MVAAASWPDFSHLPTNSCHPSKEPTLRTLHLTRGPRVPAAFHFLRVLPVVPDSGLVGAIRGWRMGRVTTTNDQHRQEGRKSQGIHPDSHSLGLPASSSAPATTGQIPDWQFLTFRQDQRADLFFLFRSMLQNRTYHFHGSDATTTTTTLGGLVPFLTSHPFFSVESSFFSC